MSRTFRIEQVPAGTVVKYLLASVGRENVVVPVRPGRRAPTRPATSLMVVHDGHGSVSVTGVQASVREVLALLSKWFDFPIVNPDTIPDVRRSMQFDRVPAAQLVDRLLRTVSVNYVILTDSQTSLPSKVLAAPLSASSASPAVSPVRRGGTAAAGLPAYPVTPPSPANPADDPNHPMYQANAPPPPIQPPMDGMPALPIDPAMLPMDPMFPAVPQPQGPPAAAPAPGAARPGMVVPATTPPGRKPPGSPGG